MKIPNWLSKHLDEKSLEVIRDSVTRAEAHTTGEIVPMIVKRSSPQNHLLGMLFFVFVASFELLFFIYSNRFEVGHPVEVQLGILLISIFLSRILVGLEIVQRILTPKADRIHNSLVRAELEFHRSKIRATTQHTGVLLFVSIMERQAVVLADEKIASSLSAEAWNGVLKTLIQGLKAKDFAIGFSKAIEQTGLILKAHFPASEHTENDLPNDLQIKE